MSFVKRMKGLPGDLVAAEGLMYQDWYAISPCQRECTKRMGLMIQREQEAYMTNHPEILALLKIFIAKITQRSKRKDFEKEAAYHFTRSFAELDEEVRTFLESPPDGPYVDLRERMRDEFDDGEFTKDIREIIINHHPPAPWIVKSPRPSTINTESSSFISIVTSEITLPTPEPIPTPEPTTSEIFYKLISNTVDKVIYVQVDEGALLYDTAYVELMKAVEQAMEIPVLDIRADLAAMFNNAFRLFEINIKEKEKLAAAAAWEKRMRKKLKRSLRIQKNFRGYETPPSTKSGSSSQEDYKAPPPRPCECQALPNYNRYAKDRFGIYLPLGLGFSKNNITTTPAISTEKLLDNEEKVESKSTLSKRSQTTTPRSTTHSIVSSTSKSNFTRRISRKRGTNPDSGSST